MTWQIPESYKDANSWIHRDNDEPAIVGADGSRAWYEHGKLHREAGPAYIDADGTQQFWLHGKFIEQKNPLNRMTPPVPSVEELRSLWRACRPGWERAHLVNLVTLYGIQLKRKDA